MSTTSHQLPDRQGRSPVTLTVQDEVGQTQTKPQTISSWHRGPDRQADASHSQDDRRKRRRSGQVRIDRDVWRCRYRGVRTFGWGDGTQPTVGQTCNVQHTFVGVGAGRPSR